MSDANRRFKTVVAISDVCLVEEDLALPMGYTSCGTVADRPKRLLLASSSCAIQDECTGPYKMRLLSLYSSTDGELRKRQRKTDCAEEAHTAVTAGVRFLPCSSRSHLHPHPHARPRPYPHPHPHPRHNRISSRFATRVEHGSPPTPSSDREERKVRFSVLTSRTARETQPTPRASRFAKREDRARS